MSGEAAENSKEWYLRRIKEEIEGGRTENALSYASLAISVAEKRDYGFDPCTCGIIELAVRNPNVMSYMEKWEWSEGSASEAILDVAAERRRQIEAEGWSTGHDDAHSDGELARAASCYAYYGSWTDSDRHKMAKRFPQNWPWERTWWKPTDRRRDLVKAAALIIAEIERLDRTPIPDGGAS